MIERVYNIILWRIYSFLRGTTKLLDGINPFRWLLQIPFIKKFYIKRGSSVEQIEAAADHVTNDPVLGSSILFANRFMMLTLFFWLLNCNMLVFHQTPFSYECRQILLISVLSEIDTIFA